MRSLSRFRSEAGKLPEYTGLKGWDARQKFKRQCAQKLYDSVHQESSKTRTQSMSRADNTASDFISMVKLEEHLGAAGAARYAQSCMKKPDRSSWCRWNEMAGVWMYNYISEGALMARKKEWELRDVSWAHV